MDKDSQVELAREIAKAVQRAWRRDIGILCLVALVIAIAVATWVGKATMDAAYSPPSTRSSGL